MTKSSQPSERGKIPLIVDLEESIFKSFNRSNFRNYYYSPEAIAQISRSLHQKAEEIALELQGKLEHLPFSSSVEMQQIPDYDLTVPRDEVPEVPLPPPIGISLPFISF